MLSLYLMFVMASQEVHCFINSFLFAILLISAHIICSDFLDCWLQHQRYVSHRLWVWPTSKVSDNLGGADLGEALLLEKGQLEDLAAQRPGMSMVIRGWGYCMCNAICLLKETHVRVRYFIISRDLYLLLFHVWP